MKKIKFDNWRDARGSELDRAKKIIVNRDVKISDASKLLGIPDQSLRNYRQDPAKLDKSSWERVNKLSQLADIIYVQDNMTQEDTIRFVSHLNQLFQEFTDCADDNDLPIISKLREIVISDPVLVTELFKYRG